MENIRIVETDGKEIVAVKRTDIDINSKKGRELAIVDNHSAKESIDLDFDVINDLVTEYDISPVEWELEKMEWDNLPSELDNVNMTPEELELLNGKNNLEYNRIIIVYKNESSKYLCDKLGIEKLNKIIYDIDELFNKE